MIVDVHEAKTHLSQLIERAAAGEEIIIARAGRPMCRLTPLQPVPEPPRLGQYAGEPFRIADDFDTLPADLAAAFEGSDP